MKAFRKIARKSSGPKLVIDATTKSKAHDVQSSATTLPQIIVTPPTPTDESCFDHLIRVPAGPTNILRAPGPTAQRRRSYSRPFELVDAKYVTISPRRLPLKNPNFMIHEELGKIDMAI